MAKIRDISRKKTTKGKHKTAGKSARKGRTPIAKKGQGKRCKKKARKRLLEDDGGNIQESTRDPSKDRATKKKSAKKSKRKKKCERDERGRIKPGSTANPNGRPKVPLSLTALLREKLASVRPGKAVTVAQELIDTLVDVAIDRGDHKMLREALDRIEGKVPDRLIAAVGSGELQNMPEDILRKAVGVIEGEKELAPDPQQEEFVGPVQPSDLEGDQDGPVPAEA